MAQNSYGRPQRSGGNNNNYRGGSSRGSNYRGNSFSRNRGFGGGGGSRRRGSDRQFIDVSKYVRAAKPVEQTVYVPKHQFNDFDINPIIKENIAKKGFKAPSRIQDEVIPYAILGRDIVGIANTGTGKTAAFVIPIINKLMMDPTQKAMIIAPTRELAAQIAVEFRSFSFNTRINYALLIGGNPMPQQFRDLKFNPKVIIGTPGRIKDHLQRGSLRLNEINNIALDEVDRMVDMGFIDDIRHLLSSCAKIRQSYFFSATLDPKLEGLVNSFLSDPIKISVKTGDTGENIDQNIIKYISREEKIEKLHTVLIEETTKKVLIFDETQVDVENLGNELTKRGFQVEAIHGGKRQSARKRALTRFKMNEVTILVATDVAARGIDVSDISHVINYSLPRTYDDYVHRIGRAGRAGRIGYALTMVKTY